LDWAGAPASMAADAVSLGQLYPQLPNRSFEARRHCQKVCRESFGAAFEADAQPEALVRAFAVLGPIAANVRAVPAPAYLAAAPA
jgi:hypothetical protein